MEPGIAVEEARPRGEVENREGDRRKGERARDPREDREHGAQEPYVAFGAEQRATTADGAEGEREHAEPCGELVTAHQQEQHRSGRENRRLDDYAQMALRPATGARAERRRPLERDAAHRTVPCRNVPHDGSSDTRSIEVTPGRHPSGLGVQPFIERDTAPVIEAMLTEQALAGNHAVPICRAPRRRRA